MAEAFRIGKSPIHGKGVFAVRPIGRGETVGLALERNDDGELLQTILSRYTNHSYRPNMVNVPKGDQFELVALHDIEPGEELVTNYAAFARAVAPEEVPSMLTAFRKRRTSKERQEIADRRQEEKRRQQRVEHELEERRSIEDPSGWRHLDRLGAALPLSKHASDPRLRLLGRLGPLRLVEVDGSIIRRDLDEEFTNLGHHFDFPFIPRDEVWIDREAHPDETPFFIQHALVEYRLRQTGMSHDEALKLADRAERAERARALGRKKGNVSAEKPKLRLLGKTPSGIQIWLVDGKTVRDNLYIDFTEGGHWLVYGWIPENEIWIDNDVMPHERAFVIIHELLEARLMARGSTYAKAHALATATEWGQRRHLDRKASSRMAKWIRDNVTEPKNHCFFYAAALAALFPGLTLMRGQHSEQRKGDRAHFWTEDEDGNIIDPTADQYPKGEYSGGAAVSLEANLDEVIKDPLFKTLGPDDQESIIARSAESPSKRRIGLRRYTMLLPFSKRAAVGEGAYWRIAHELVEKRRSEIGREFFGWQNSPTSGRRLMAHPPAAIRQYLDQNLPKDVIVQEVEGDEGVFHSVPRKFTSPQPVIGRWMHVVNNEIVNLKAFLPRFMTLHGEVCFSSTIGTHTVYMSGGDFLTIVVDGPARTAFKNDVYSDFDPWTGRRYISSGRVPILQTADTGIQEAWVVPAETKLVGVLTNSPEYAKEAKEMGVPVFGAEPFGDREPEETPEPKEWDRAGKHPLGEGWEPPLSSRTASAEDEDMPWTPEELEEIERQANKPLAEEEERLSDEYWENLGRQLEEQDRNRPKRRRSEMTAEEIEFLAEMDSDEQEEFMNRHFLPKNASFPFSKRAKDHSYVGKRKEESGNITYLYDKKHIAERNRKKEKRLKKLSGSLKKVRAKVKKDLSSEDEKTRLAALAIALIDETYERVGNEESASELKHFGVTGWLLKHVTLGKTKATFKYVGKAGVKQTKEVKDKAVLKALRRACEGKKKSDRILDISAKDVNAYLTPFHITAKDIRGYHANKEMLRALKANGKPPKGDEKALKERFKKALTDAAKKVGHEPGTLKRQYLIPRIEQYYMEGKNVRGILASQTIPFSKFAKRYNVKEEYIWMWDDKGRRLKIKRNVENGKEIKGIDHASLAEELGISAREALDAPRGFVTYPTEGPPEVATYGMPFSRLLDISPRAYNAVERVFELMPGAYRQEVLPMPRGSHEAIMGAKPPLSKRKDQTVEATWLPFSKRAFGPSLTPPPQVIQDILNYIVPLYAAGVLAWAKPPPSYDEVVRLAKENQPAAEEAQTKREALEEGADPEGMLPLEIGGGWHWDDGRVESLPGFRVALAKRPSGEVELNLFQGDKVRSISTSSDPSKQWLRKQLVGHLEEIANVVQWATDSLYNVNRQMDVEGVQNVAKADAAVLVELPSEHSTQLVFPGTNEPYLVKVKLNPHGKELRACLKKAIPATLLFEFGADSIPVRTPRAYSAQKEELEESVRHEAVHLMQRLQAQRRNLPEEKVGLPPMSIRTPSGKEDWRREHSLIEAEFYANLVNSENRIRKVLEAIPVEKRWQRFKEMVALEGLGARDLIWSMFVLRERAPEKWRHAVKLLLPRVADLLPQRKLEGPIGKLPIHFPPEEHEALKTRLNRGQPIYTTRISRERGKYRPGQELKTPWGQIVRVTEVKQLQGLKNHPFVDELTEDQKELIGGHKFDLVKLETIPEPKRKSRRAQTSPPISKRAALESLTPNDVDELAHWIAQQAIEGIAENTALTVHEQRDSQDSFGPQTIMADGGSILQLADEIAWDLLPSVVFIKQKAFLRQLLLDLGDMIKAKHLKMPYELNYGLLGALRRLEAKDGHAKLNRSQQREIAPDWNALVTTFSQQLMDAVAKKGKDAEWVVTAYMPHGVDAVLDMVAEYQPEDAWSQAGQKFKQLKVDAATNEEAAELLEKTREEIREKARMLVPKLIREQFKWAARSVPLSKRADKDSAERGRQEEFTALYQLVGLALKETKGYDKLPRWQQEMFDDVADALWDKNLPRARHYVDQILKFVVAHAMPPPISKHAETSDQKEITFLFQLLAEALREVGGFTKLEPWLKSRFEDIVDVLWKGDLPYAKKLVDRFLVYTKASARVPLSKRAGLFEPPPIFTEALQKLLVQHYASLVTETEGVPEDVRTMAAKFAKHEMFQPAFLDVDLAGWKYLDLLPPRLREPQEDEWSGGKVAPYPAVSVRISVIPQGQKETGKWRKNSWRIDLNIPEPWLTPADTDEFTSTVRRLLMVAQHEATHMAQDILADAKKLRDQGGLPSRKHRIPGSESTGLVPRDKASLTGLPVEELEKVRTDFAIPHSLRDVEFHPRMNDLAKLFSSKLADLAPAERREALKRLLSESAFLKRLRTHNPPRWREALRLLVSTISASSLFDDRPPLAKRVNPAAPKSVSIPGAPPG